MTARATRKGLLAATALATGLALSACGGGGFDSDSGGGGGDGEGSSSDGAVELNMLIASSGDAETAAVKDAVKKWGDESGNTVKVTVASDMAQELAQGFAGGNPPDVFYLDASQFADYATNGSLYAYGDQVDDPTTSTSRCATPSPTTTPLLLRAEGLLHARPGDQHRRVGEGRADRRRHPHRLGRAGRRRREADHR